MPIRWRLRVIAPVLPCRPGHSTAWMAPRNAQRGDILGYFAAVFDVIKRISMEVVTGSSIASGRISVSIVSSRIGIDRYRRRQPDEILFRKGCRH
jgi:hypothetical protein